MLKFLRFSPLIVTLLFIVLLGSCMKKRSGNARVLVFTKTSGFYHNSIEAGKAAILNMGKEHGFDVDTTSNANWFTEDTLKKYSAIVFLNSTGDLLNHYQEAEFERYIQAGGGYVGVHAAADAEYDWGWYGRLVGGYFKSHPEVQEAKLTILDQSHLSTKDLPENWNHTDEWYDYKNLSKEVKVLISIDKDSYNGASENGEHPITWYHDYDGGRAFYTGLGHLEDDYSDPLFLKHLLGGIEYAIGKNYELNYDKSTTLKVPEEERFIKTVLSEGEFFEPTEMAILPNLDILIAQRRGELMLYSQDDKLLTQVGFLNVYHSTGNSKVNAEEGFMGLTADPNFEKNNFIYAFYSPVDTSVNRLSRFVFKNNKLDLQSEKVILQFYSQRGICCHTGGSLSFGKDNLLYLSTGDNSTPFDEPDQAFVNRGYAPLDGRPGHEQYDAARSSGNSNDLRGKILRIKINEDASYSIPEGNLFSSDQPKTRPEIYVMGNRNPYRISVDKKNGFLYWGEVGPDATVDSLDSRGPRGYDEINQARQAGFFGWPFFVANNYPYFSYNYDNGISGNAFVSNKPVNNSPNNTGITELPPAQPAFIWYPYDASIEFPQVGSGSRNALAGPIYYTEQFPKETRYPDYYNGKLFIYDWIRNWIKVVSMKPNGDFDSMEPFMENAALASPIDMEVGPDGKIYLLEYGKGWFSQNPDAGISRIDYYGGELPDKITRQNTTEQTVADNFENLDKAGANLGHKEGLDEKRSIASKAKSLIVTSDCGSCHNEDKASIGPSYKEISKRYQENPDGLKMLSDKIIKGGSGVWGEVAMPAHPSMKNSEAKEIVKWILSL